MVERLFLSMPQGCLRFVIVVFPDHTHLYYFSAISTHLRLIWGRLHSTSRLLLEAILYAHVVMRIAVFLWHLVELFVFYLLMHMLVAHISFC